MRRRAFNLSAGLAAGLLAIPGASFGQSFPARPVRMVAPYAPGGSSSAAAQSLAQLFLEISGQPLVLDYKPGAASNIGSDLVAKSAPDGYTVLMGTSSLAINPNLYRSLPFDPQKDLAPVTILFRTSNVLAVNPSLPIHSVKDLISHARANPGKLNYGSAGSGATNHMAMELLKYMAKVDIVHVPFKGGGEALPALMSGEIQVMFSPAATLAAQAKAGRVRMIAVSGSQPAGGLPTVAESGLPGFESTVWFGMFAPAGTPGPVISKLNADVNRALKERRMLDVLATHGLEGVGGPPEDLKKLLLADHERWATVVKATGIKID